MMNSGPIRINNIKMYNTNPRALFKILSDCFLSFFKFKLTAIRACYLGIEVMSEMTDSTPPRRPTLCQKEQGLNSSRTSAGPHLGGALAHWSILAPLLYQQIGEHFKKFEYL